MQPYFISSMMEVIAASFRSPPLTRIIVGGLTACSLAPAPASGQAVEWSQRSSSGPTPRALHAMAYDSARGVTVLFGGNLPLGTRNNETWEWDGTTWTRRGVSGPSARYFHAMAYDAARGVTVLFGGDTGGPPYSNETWEWNGTAWTRRLVAGPSGRAVTANAIAYDASRGVTVLFGGFTGGPGFNDETWEWDGTAWTQRLVSGPSARNGHAMAYDAARSVTVLFGGSIGLGVSSGETWEWNGTAWTLRSSSGPSPRSSPMVYDTARGLSVLFGGNTGGGAFNDETWEWHGTGWLQQSLPSPAARRDHAMAYDQARGVTVLFGGYTGFNVRSNDTWELGVPCVQPSITNDPVAQTVCPGGPASFTVAAAGIGPFAYQWRHGEPPSPIPDATEDTYVIKAASVADEGPYDCVVSNSCGSATSTPATLTLCAPDFDCSGTLNSQDFFDFLVAFFAQSTTADFNGDGLVNSQDFFDFLGAFFAGC